MKLIVPSLVLAAAAAVIVSPLLLGSDPAPTPGQADLMAAPDDSPQADQGTGKIVGYYTGAFGKNKITIRIEKVVGESVLGYSIVAGNERAFSGSARLADGGVRVTAREPGTDRNDGIFEFFVVPDATSLNGTWWAYDKKLETKFYKLARRTFRYDPNVGLYPQSSTKMLAKADVENFSQMELRVMRSEIYARHGYSFKKRDIREYFDDKDWYMPMAMDIAAQLTPVEKKNEALIKRYETYAAEYYDSFGR